MMVSIFNSVSDPGAARVREAYLTRLHEIANDSCSLAGYPLAEVTTDETVAAGDAMTPNNHNGHSLSTTSLAEVLETVTLPIDNPPDNEPRAVTVKELCAPWQQLAEQVGPMFGEALKAAAETLYRMTAQRQATLESSLAGVVVVADKVNTLVHNLQSVRETATSLTESHLALTARTGELEASLEKKVYAALEQAVKCLDEGMRERQDTTERTLSALADEVCRASQRLEVHAGAIRTLAEAIQSQIERRVEFNNGLEKLVELARLPATLGPLPDNL